MEISSTKFGAIAQNFIVIKNIFSNILEQYLGVPAICILTNELLRTKDEIKYKRLYLCA